VSCLGLLGVTFESGLARSRILHMRDVFLVLVNCVMNNEFNPRVGTCVYLFYLFYSIYSIKVLRVKRLEENPNQLWHKFYVIKEIFW